MTSHLSVRKQFNILFPRENQR